jgi:hypothetical protein
MPKFGLKILVMRYINSSGRFRISIEDNSYRLDFYACGDMGSELYLTGRSKDQGEILGWKRKQAEKYNYD